MCIFVSDCMQQNAMKNKKTRKRGKFRIPYCAKWLIVQCPTGFGDMFYYAPSDIFLWSSQLSIQGLATRCRIDMPRFSFHPNLKEFLEKSAIFRVFSQNILGRPKGSGWLSPALTRPTFVSKEICPCPQDTSILN